MPVLIGPQLAQALPGDVSETLGNYLLEGLGREYTLFAPVDWSDLVPPDQLWAAATTTGASTIDDGPEGWTVSSPRLLPAAVGHPLGSISGSRHDA